MIRSIKRLNPETRLLLSIGLAVLVFFGLPKSLGTEIHILAAWDLGVLCFLLLVGLTLTSCTSPIELKRQPQYDFRSRIEGSFTVILLKAFA